MPKKINTTIIIDGPGVYAIWFRTNPSKKYYGSTKKIHTRLYQHFCKLRKGNHTNRVLQSDFNNLKEKCFCHYIAIAKVKNARVFENTLINTHKNCYNTSNVFALHKRKIPKRKPEMTFIVRPDRAIKQTVEGENQ